MDALVVGMAALLVVGVVVWFFRPNRTERFWRSTNHRQSKRQGHDSQAPSDIDLLSDRIEGVLRILQDLKAEQKQIDQIVRETADLIRTQRPLRELATVPPMGAHDVRISAAPSPPGQLRSVGFEADLVIDEFLNRANDGPLSYLEAQELARTKGRQLKIAKSVGDEWRVVAVDRGVANGEWLAVPVPRLPMGNVELETWYELAGYSGIDPLKPAQIRKPAVLTERNGTWSLLQKGRIDGSQ